MITYEKIKWSPDFAAELMMMAQEHCDESSSSLGQMKLNLEVYFTLDMMGTLDTFVALDDGKLVGYLVTITLPHNHHADKLVCNEDAFFVSKDYRKGRVGINLMKMSEKSAKERGASFISMTCAENNDLSKFYKRFGYKPFGMVFYKEIGG